MLASLSALLGLPILFGSTTIQSYICQPPTLASITTPTNNANITAGRTIQIDGAATASSKVMLDEDGNTIASLTADQNNQYATQAAFSVGSHDLMIHVISECGNLDSPVTKLTATQPAQPTFPPTSSTQGSSSNALNASGDSNKASGSSTSQSTALQSPKLTINIDKTLDGSSTAKSSLYLAGTTNLATVVHINVNGVEVASSNLASTNFGFLLPLNIGSNTITITATSGEDNVAVSLTVVRDAAAKNTTELKKHTPWYDTFLGRVAITGFIILLITAILKGAKII